MITRCSRSRTGRDRAARPRAGPCDAHTLKGSAARVAFDAVSELAHDHEAVLERLRKKDLAVTDVLVTLLLRSVDVLRGRRSRASLGPAALGRLRGSGRHRPPA